MTDFSKKTETERFFDSIKDDLKQSKVKAVFYLSACSYHFHEGLRIYDTDDEVYILLQNGNCLVITYPFIDSLNVQFRQMTEAEQKKYQNIREKDLFNTSIDVYDYRSQTICETDTCQLEYGFIENVSLRSVTWEYDKWLDDEIVFVSPTEETFDEIEFAMSNGKKFVICADCAEADGYVQFWSKDAIEMIKKNLP